MTFTSDPNLWVIAALVFLLGLLIGVFLTAGGRRKWKTRYNSELANNLGNLVNRTLNMTNRFAGGVVPAGASAAEVATDANLAPERELRALWDRTRDEFITLSEGFQFHIALERAFSFVTATNRYVEQRAPWKLGKSTEAADQALLKTSLATMAGKFSTSSFALGGGAVEKM